MDLLPLLFYIYFRYFSQLKKEKTCYASVWSKGANVKMYRNKAYIFIAYNYGLDTRSANYNQISFSRHLSCPGLLSSLKRSNWPTYRWSEFEPILMRPAGIITNVMHAPYSGRHGLLLHCRMCFSAPQTAFLKIYCWYTQVAVRSRLILPSPLFFHHTPTPFSSQSSPSPTAATQMAAVWPRCSCLLVLILQSWLFRLIPHSEPWLPARSVINGTKASRSSYCYIHQCHCCLFSSQSHCDPAHYNSTHKTNLAVQARLWKELSTFSSVLCMIRASK